MALGAALVDRARIIRNVPQPRKIEGRTQFAKVTLPWFRCRVQMPNKPRTADAAGGRTRAEARPTLLYGIRDSEGNAISLTSTDELEVQVKEIAEHALYQVDADPMPLRKRRSVIGWEVPLKRIENHAFTDPRV